MDGSDYLSQIPGWDVLVLGLLFLGSFFFSGTETALTSLGEARARQLQGQLGARGKILRLWIQHPRKVLTALLIGNNLVNVGASAFATSLALDFFESGAIAIATGVMTLLLLIFCEITPKTIAREHPDRWAIPALYLLRPVYVAVYPLSFVLTRMSLTIAGWHGGERERPLVSSEDVDFLIGLSAREGALDEVKEQLLTNVLEFTDLQVKEILIPRTSVIGLDVTTPLGAALEVAEETGHSRIPVYDGSIDEVVGILSVKDLIPKLRVGSSPDLPADLRVIARPAWFVPELMKVSDLLAEMQRRRSHLAIVVDEFGGTAGIVTLEDVVEEIFGEIRDEHDTDPAPITRLPGGRMLVEASLPLRDLEDELDIEFPDDGDYESLGGFLTALAGAVPAVGDEVSHGGFDFVVRSSDEKRVLRVEVSPSPKDTDTNVSDDEPQRSAS